MESAISDNLTWHSLMQPEKSTLNWNHRSICVFCVSLKHTRSPTGSGINTSITDGYLLMSQQRNNKIWGGDGTTETETATQPAKKYKEETSDEERDGEGEGRSWWTAVGLFTSRISLFSRCLAAHQGKRTERGRGDGEREQKDVSDWRFVVVARLDSSCVFYDLHIQSAAWSAAGVGGRNALSQGEMGKHQD